MSTSPTTAADATGPGATYAEADARYLAVLRQLQDELSTRAGVQWEGPPKRTQVLPCDDGRKAADYTTGATVGTLSDDRWLEAVRVLNRAISGLGFTEVTVLADAPGKHVLSIAGPERSKLIFGSEVRVDATIIGACLPDPAG